MAYTFQKLPTGKIQVYENGKAIYKTGIDESYAKQLGYKPAATAQLPQSQLDAISKQVAQISQQAQTIATQIPSVSQATAQPANDYRAQMNENQQVIYDTLNPQLDTLTAKGQTINPYVEITPVQAAEFLAQAEREMSPYYQTQMKLERDNMLRSVGYDTQSLDLFEQQMEKTYGKNLNVLGENMAESGFAYSGKRKTEESDLAYNTQTQIDEQRRALANQAANTTSAYAQRWGSANLPTTSAMSAAPKVLPGQAGFDKSGTSTLLYSLSPELYDNLIGTQQYEQTTQQKARASQLEGAYKEQELINRQRQLTL